MVQAASIKTWAIQAEDAPAHIGRLPLSALLNEGVVDVAGGSFQVAQDTGSNMQVKVGSGVLGDLAAVEGDAIAGQGIYVFEHQDPTITLVIAASDPTNARIDLVVARTYDDEADSSGNSYTDVEAIQGTPSGSPSAPALPDSAVPLAEVEVGAGVTAITDANITDLRAEATLTQNARLSGPLGLLGVTKKNTPQNGVTSTETDLTGLSVTVDVAANRRILITALITATPSVNDNTARLKIKEGSTVLQTMQLVLGRTNGSETIAGSIDVTPSAGSHIYKLSLQMALGSGTVDMFADANFTAFIRVEDIGPA